MCGSSAAAEIQDGGRQLEEMASTAAHELGHNLNMAHDDSPTGTRVSRYIRVITTHRIILS